MENKQYNGFGKHGFTLIEPNATRPVWTDQKMVCNSCHYNDQDIDTFPCAKCHTRMQ